MKNSRVYLEMFNTPNLVKMLNNNENVEIIESILKEREETFFERVTETAEYHEQ